MTDTQYKVKNLEPGSTTPAFPTLACVYPAPFKEAAWEDDLSSVDVPISSNARLVASQHMGGSGRFMVGYGAGGGASQTYPDPDAWRTVLRSKGNLAPGNALFFRVLALESGQTEVYNPSNATWETTGNQGAVRLIVYYENEDGDYTSYAYEKILEGNFLSDGNAWLRLVCLTAKGLTHLLNAGNNAAEQSKWSEWPRYTIQIQHRGGARIIQAVVHEAPHWHSAFHEDEEISIHGWTQTGSTPRPQIEDADGGTYEEHRYGTLRAMHAAKRQSLRYGAHVAHWTSYAEGLAEPGDTEQDPFTITSTSWVGLSVGSAITDWDTDSPGYAIHAPPCGRSPENLHTRMRIDADADGEYYASAIPVKVGVYARKPSGAKPGYVKFQSSPRSMVIVEVAASADWEWYETSGWLEASSSGADSYSNLMDFAKVVDGTMEIRDWYVDYGDYPT